MTIRSRANSPAKSPARQFFRATLAWAFAFSVLCGPAHAQIWWTGGGDGTTWSQGANWSSGVAPQFDDEVWLGYADAGGTGVADAPQNINLDGDFSVGRVDVFSEGNRAVTVGGGVLTVTAGNREAGIVVHAAGENITTFHNDVLLNRRAVIVQSSSHDLFLNGDISNAPDGPENPGFNGGGWEFFIDNSGTNVVFQGTGSQSVGRMEAREADSLVTMNNPDVTMGRIQFDGDNSTLRYQANATLGTLMLSAGNADLALERDGSSDITSFATGGMDVFGEASSSIVILPGAPGQGHFTFQLARAGNGQSNDSGIGEGPAIVTAADSTVELRQHGNSNRRGIFAAENERISGDGDVLLNMNSAGTTFSLFGVLTHTGRTMLETGVL